MGFASSSSLFSFSSRKVRIGIRDERPPWMPAPEATRASLQGQTSETHHPFDIPGTKAFLRPHS